MTDWDHSLLAVQKWVFVFGDKKITAFIMHFDFLNFADFLH